MPKAWIFYEDIEVGEGGFTGSYPVTREEILDFGRRWDPQPFHVDEDAAAASHFGGLVASGWNTTAIAMRLMVDSLRENGGESLGSPGTEEIRWLRPVRPGDTLKAHLEVVGKRELASRADRGLVKLKTRLFNQNEEEVMVMTSFGMFRRRVEA